MLIVNPVASTMCKPLLEEVVRRLKRAVSLTVAQTEGKGDGVELARDARRRGLDLVAVLGGDGTVNEAVNGITDDDVPGIAPLLGIIGGGSTNVLARAVGLPGHPVAAVERLIGLLWSRQRRTLRLSTAQGRYFTFAAGLGFDAALVRAMERRRGRRLPTPDVWVSTGLRLLVRDATHVRPRVRVMIEDEEVALGSFALMGNGPIFSYLGTQPFRPTPLAQMEGGFDILVAESSRVLPSARGVLGMLSPLPPSGYPGLPVLHDLDHCTLVCEAPLPLQLDGEYLGEFDHVELRGKVAEVTIVAPALLPGLTAFGRHEGRPNEAVEEERVQ